MPTDVALAREMVSGARKTLSDNLRMVTLEEVLYAAGGYRSSLGVLKHIAGWAHVYRSYAFDPMPCHWERTAWPRGLIDTVDLSKEYFAEIGAWADEALQLWDEALAGVAPGTLDQPRPLHWGATAPLSTIAWLVAQHVVFHTGELNMLLSISRGEAWEYSEEVEENHISTWGHGVRAPWMSEAQARAHEDRMRAAARDR
jgi:hypothetical protein